MLRTISGPSDNLLYAEDQGGTIVAAWAEQGVAPGVGMSLGLECRKVRCIRCQHTGHKRGKHARGVQV